MTRSVSNLLWGIGLLVAAFVLAKRAEDPLPWAVGLLAIIDVLGSGLGALVENDRKTTAASSGARAAAKASTTVTPGATETQ
jgi:hypothetical protein